MQLLLHNCDQLAWVQRKRPRLTPQGRHYFLVLPGVLRQHSQSPRQPHIQPPWYCVSATARCIKRAWDGEKKESEVRKAAKWEGWTEKDVGKSPMHWRRHTLTHLRLQHVRLSRLEPTEPDCIYDDVMLQCWERLQWYCKFTGGYRFHKDMRFFFNVALTCSHRSSSMYFHNSWTVFLDDTWYRFDFAIIPQRSFHFFKCRPH